jgi:hypothetical protein
MYSSPTIAGDKIEKNERGGGGEGRGDACTGFWWINLRERDHCGDPGVDGKVVLRWILRKWIVGVRTGLMCLRIGTGGDTFECGNEPSGSVKCVEFLDWLRTG